jgi:RHS repeat-associated protein
VQDYDFMCRRRIMCKAGGGYPDLERIVPLPGGAFAVYADSGLLQYNHADWLGSARLFSTPSRGAVPAMAYAPFGEGYTSVADGYVQFTGAGNEWTVADGNNLTGSLVDFMFRRYNPTQGRWISPDPLGRGAVKLTNPQSWNRYAYVLNNPLSYTDPLGLECVWDDGSFDAADDPQTGSAGGCAGQGGTWVDPDLFENAMLTSGQWNSNYGDWSGSANANLAQNWAVSSASASATFTDPNSILSSLSSNLNYAFNATSSFFRGFTIDTSSDSCLGVALDSYKPVANAFKKTQDYAKNYVAPIVASLPGAGASLANGLYSTVQYGADRGNALEMGGAISAAGTFLATQGQAAVSALANLAKNPAVLGVTADAALAWGVGNEAVAAYQGKCH